MTNDENDPLKFRFSILGIGAVIGHEITHGFDDNGRQYDKEGNRVLWWTPETIDQFNQRKKCIVDQYSNYLLDQINHTVIMIFFPIEIDQNFLPRSTEIKLKVKISLIMAE